MESPNFKEENLFSFTCILFFSYLRKKNPLWKRKKLDKKTYFCRVLIIMTKNGSKKETAPLTGKNNNN